MATAQRHGATLQSLSILTKVETIVDDLLTTVSSRDAGYLAITEIVRQIKSDIQDAKERAERETLRIGILGGRGSGKSTLANALIGVELLPESAIVFCTSIPTTIKYAPAYHLQVSSDIESNNVDEQTNDTDYVRATLNSICKESENQDNVKQITKISLGIPNLLLDGKEIVDVPGFTKGNDLHQAFAERYAKYYCDLCIVLINNSESVEINGDGGLPALCKTFRGRLDSTIFILNKADQSSDGDIEYIMKTLSRHVEGGAPTVFVVSARNTMKETGDRFEFNKLLGYLSFLSGRKVVFLVRALLYRLISNFAALRDLCRLSSSTLSAIGLDLEKLATSEFNEIERTLRRQVAPEAVIPRDFAALDLSRLTLPHQLNATGAFDYENQILRVLATHGTELLSDHAQKQQAQIFKLFTTSFDQQLASFEAQIRSRLADFESKFGVRTEIAPPSIQKAFRLKAFDPATIERLRPPKFRLWCERNLPNILVREVVFWKSPVTLKLPLGIGVAISLPLPAGLIGRTRALEEKAKVVPEKVVAIMNEYLFEAMSGFVREMGSEYDRALDDYIAAWAGCLLEYSRKVQLAKDLTEPSAMSRFESVSSTLSELVAEANGLVVPT